VVAWPGCLQVSSGGLIWRPGHCPDLSHRQQVTGLPVLVKATTVISRRRRPRRRDKNVFESKQYAGAATVAYAYLSQSGQLRIILYLALIKENSDSDGNREQGTELTAQENERERRQPRITKRRCPTPKSGRCITERQGHAHCDRHMQRTVHPHCWDAAPACSS
jgi:hypothetical protein